MADDQRAERHASRTRGGDGKYARDPDTAKRDAEACALRGKGWSYRRIADELDMGSPSTAYEAVQRALRDTQQEPADEVRQLARKRLDAMYAKVMEVLEGEHFVVSHGKLIYEHGEPLADDGPVLQAIATLLKIEERRAKLDGLDAPTRQELGGKLTYEITGVDLEKL